MESPSDPPTVLVVDDVDDERALAVEALRRGGLRVREARDAAEAELILTSEPVSLVVLDIGLPGRNGLQMLGSLREDSRVPVILLTGRSGDVDKVIGLEIGADDYVVKPFSPRELVARVVAVLRRTGSEPPAPTTRRIGGLKVDTVRRTATADGREIDLTRREFDVLAELAAAGGRVVTREDLLASVWTAGEGSDASLTEHVRRVRLALGDEAGVIIRTLRGVGYVLEA